MTRYVYDFDEPSEGGREPARRQGGRPRRDDAARRARSRRLHDHDRRLPRLHGGRRRGRGARRGGRGARRAARGADRQALRRPDDPLLVSVRSGAAISMPGMMDTILNLGLNDVAVAGLARSTGNEGFARDSYRRLIQMYGETVDGHRARELQRRRLRRAGAREIYERRDRPGTSRRTRASSCAARSRAVFDSWNSPRAQVYRRTYEIPDDLGTAVNVVQMVFGNKGDGSATGVCFTRDPSTGEQGVYGEFLVNAQGEDVVAGHPHAGAARRAARAHARRVRPAPRDDGRARAPLPRHAGHRVHGRGGHALPPADAHREADGGGRDQGARSTWRRRA